VPLPRNSIGTHASSSRGFSLSYLMPTHCFLIDIRQTLFYNQYYDATRPASHAKGHTLSPADTSKERRKKIFNMLQSVRSKQRVKESREAALSWLFGCAAIGV